MAELKPREAFGNPTAANLVSVPEVATEVVPSAVKEEVPVAMLDSFLGEAGFNFKDVALEKTEKEYGVVRSTDGSSNEVLLFDVEAVAKHEKEFITRYLAAVEGKGKDGLKGTYFEFFYGNMSDEFINELTAKMRERLSNIEQGQLIPPTLASKSLKDDSLMKAAEEFRDMARRRQMKEALKKQFDKLPIKEFIGIKSDGSGEEVINPKDIDYITANNSKGDAELIITCTNTDKYTQIIPIYYPPDEEVVDKTLRRTPGTGETKTVTTDKKSGRDLTHYEFLVTEGTADISPLFTKVRILTAPVNLDEEIKEYEEAEEQRRQKEQAKKAAAQAAAYSSTTPSVSTRPAQNYQSRPTTYVRSGG